MKAIFGILFLPQRHRDRRNFSFSVFSVPLCFILCAFACLRETGFAQTTLYVDGGWGSNAWDGLTAVYTNGHGPKLNVSNTISAATSGDTLSIASGFYQEFTWNPGIKSLTLIPQSLVTIYDTNPATTDTDGDGMPDQWEAKYGLNGFDPDDANADADNDTISNLDEYLAGTDPTNPDTTPPVLTATATPTPNANGWNTNNVLVEFSAVDSESGVAYVTSSVTVTNEVIDLLVEGMAIDAAGNRAFDAVVVRIDKSEPTVTGNPGDGDIINSLRPPFVIQYSDEGSGADELSLDVVLDGTNVTANFQSHVIGALWNPTNDLAVGSHTWQITVADLARHEVMAEATFTITTNSALISALNLPDGAIMPDVEAVWVQGKRDDTNTVVSYSVNYGAPNAFNERWDQFGMLVPLDFGTNIVEITGSMGGTNTTMALVVIRSDRYRAKLNAPTSGDFVMDGPAMGYFANGEPQDVTGYVSQTLDEGTEEEAALSSVTVNGVTTSLGTANENGDVPFDTVDPVSVTTNFSSATVTVCYTNSAGTQCHTIPLGVWEGYFVRQRDTTRQDIYYDFSMPAPVACPQGGWWVDYPHQEIHRYQFSSLLTGTNEFGWTENYFSQDPQTAEQITKCQPQPDVEAIEWEFWHNSGESSGYTTQPGRGLRFGFEDGYAHEYVDYNFDEVLDSERILEGHQREDEGWLTFVAPVYYGSATPVIFTFEGVDYARTNALDLTQIMYHNEAPVVTNGNQVGYVITVNGGQEYTITEGDFSWPAGYETVTTNYFTEGYLVSHSMQDWFSFSGFHNGRVRILVNDTGDVDDDLVRLKLTIGETDYRRFVHCRVCNDGKPVETVVLTSSSNRVRFHVENENHQPEEVGQEQIQLSIQPNKCGDFFISGQTASQAKGDAKIIAHSGNAAGPSVAERDVTVFWFDGKIEVKKDGYYTIDQDGAAGFFDVNEGFAVTISASAELKPAGLVTAPTKVPKPLQKLKVTIVQNVAAGAKLSALYGNPEILAGDWADGTQSGTTAVIPERRELSGTLPAQQLDVQGEPVDWPWYADNGQGNWFFQYNSQTSPPFGMKLAAHIVTAGDRPNFPTEQTRKVDALDANGNPVGEATYHRLSADIDNSFFVWAVVDDGTDQIPVKEATWKLQVHYPEADQTTQKAKVTKTNGAVTQLPIQVAPLANEVINDSANEKNMSPVGGSTISIIKP